MFSRVKQTVVSPPDFTVGHQCSSLFTLGRNKITLKFNKTKVVLIQVSRVNIMNIFVWYRQSNRFSYFCFAAIIRTRVTSFSPCILRMRLHFSITVLTSSRMYPRLVHVHWNDLLLTCPSLRCLGLRSYSFYSILSVFKYHLEWNHNFVVILYLCILKQSFMKLNRSFNNCLVYIFPFYDVTLQN